MPTRSPASAEARAIVRLAAPVVAVQLGMMLMGTVDVMMLGRLSDIALAAGAVGNAIGFGLLMFPIGLLMALDPLVSQAFGAGDHERIRNHLQRGVVLAVAISIPVSALMWDTEGVLRLLGQKETIVGPASGYIRALIPGNVAFLLFGVFRQSLQAMSIVRPAMVSIVGANLVNVGTNYALIFGHFGAPRLGVVGSAYATSASRWVMLVGILLAAKPALEPYLRAPGLAALQPRRYRSFLTIGVPVGVTISLELWVFATVALMMGSLGAVALAGHQISISLASLSFMVPLGIAGAAATRVGNAIGRGDQAAAARSAALSLGLGAATMAVFAVCFWSFPATLARMYTGSSDVIEVVLVLLPIAAVFQVADGLQVVGAGVLRGTADTRLPAVIAFVGYWLVGLPVGWLLARRLGLGPAGLWWGLTLGLASVAALLLLRIRIRFKGEISRFADDEHPLVPGRSVVD